MRRAVSGATPEGRRGAYPPVGPSVGRGQPTLPPMPPCDSDGARAPSDGELARAELVPMLRLRRVPPRAASVRRPERGVSGAWTETLARRARRQSPALLRASGQPEGEPATDGARRSRMAVGACGDRHGHAAACGRLGRRAYKRRNVTSRRKSRFRPREWCPAVGRAKSTASRSCAVGSIASSSVPLESHRWRMLRAFVSSPRLCCIKGRADSSSPRVRSQVQPEGARAPTRVEDELQPLGR